MTDFIIVIIDTFSIQEEHREVYNFMLIAAAPPLSLDTSFLGFFAGLILECTYCFGFSVSQGNFSTVLFFLPLPHYSMSAVSF